MQGHVPQPERQIVINGVGLIGGSIAAAVRRRFPDTRIVGIGRSETRLQAAEDAGLLDGWSTRLDASHVQDGVVIICLPVDMIVDAVRQTASLASGHVLITDAGSTKARICDRVSQDPAAARLFVGAHPIAGSDRGGFEHAREDLFEGRSCIVTESSAGAERVERTERFWRSLGCRVTRMTAQQHDRILARTSHLPHLLASVAAACVAEDQLPFTGSGFRDTTRVAAGSPSLWQQILCCNRDEVLSSIGEAESQLKKLRAAIQDGDSDVLQKLLDDAARRRSQLDEDS
ncbi:MAG: prephenate dehydrogenase/arogenate dehydrogenase family protein [Planctomycetaceae bacterium]